MARAARGRKEEAGAVTAAEMVFDTVPEPPLDGMAAPAAALQGFIDEANPSRIAGWIWNRLQPEQRLEVELIDGDTRLARVVADQYRADLLQAGIGDGRHGFAIPVGDGLLPFDRHVLRLRCAASGAELPGSPVV